MGLQNSCAREIKSPTEIEYICNPVTKKWIKKGGDENQELIHQGILKQLPPPIFYVPEEKCSQKSKFADDPQYICNHLTGKWIKIGGQTYRELIAMRALKSENNYCDNLGTMMNEFNSCYVDSTIVSLLFKNNSYINDYLLNVDLSKLYITRIIDSGQKKWTESGRKDQFGKSIMIEVPILANVPILLSSVPNLYRIVESIKKDLELIGEQLFQGKQNVCVPLRKHLQQYISEFNKSDLGSRMALFNWETEQQEPRDVMTMLNTIFRLPDVADVAFSSFVSNEDNGCDDTNMIVVSSEISQKPVNINVSFDSLTEFNMDPVTADEYPLIPQKGQLDLLSFVNKTTCTVFENPSDYFKFKGNIYKTRIEDIEYLKAPMLYIHIDRLNPLLGKIRTPILPSEKIKLRNNKKFLELSSIIIHGGGAEGGHYMAYLNCNEIWYFYDDTKKGLRKIGNFEAMKKDQSATLTPDDPVNILLDATDYFYM